MLKNMLGHTSVFRQSRSLSKDSILGGRMKRISGLLLGFLLSCNACAAFAESFPVTSNIYGASGLNIIPNARMDSAGTVSLSLGTVDPYIHTQLGFQISDDIYLGLRQTGEISSLLYDPDYLMPGMDLKFRLFEERKFRPEIALGFQSAFGHRRMAGEYLAFSKRYENFDFTAGFGWGRFGTNFKSPNPLDWTKSYLSDDRDLDGEDPNGPKDWFTGDTGIFGGVEYGLPIRGLSLKADISSDGWETEKNLGIHRPSPFSIGLAYKPLPEIDIGIAALGTDTIMARASLKTMMENWPFSQANQESLLSIHPPGNAERYAKRMGNLSGDGREVKTQLALTPFQSSPHQLSQAWRIASGVTRESQPDVLRIEPVYFGLKAPAIAISNNDLKAGVAHQGSAEEIWRNTTFDSNVSRDTKSIRSFIPFLTLRENFSLSEEDAGLIHHTDILATLTRQIGSYFLSETSLRYNIFSSLDDIHKFRNRSQDPVRSDIDEYYEQKAAVDRLFFQGFKSFTTDWHISGSLGYLDELFAGFHGEILYRPWGKNWALGLEIADAIKRDPESPFNLGIVNRSRPTGHLNFYYEVPNTSLTLHASLGQYLGQDKGGSLSLKNTFRNGSTLEGFMTATDRDDRDALGGKSNFYAGLRFTLPFGSLTFVPDGSGIEVNAAPLGRDSGQRLDLSHPLYEMTEPLSYRHITQNWGDILQ